MIRTLTGDARDILPTLAAGGVQCVVTSPPYYGLRDYGVDGQIGLEASPEEYIATMVGVFREVRRVLRDDGTLWLNIGDSYNGYMANQRGTGLETNRQQARAYIEPGAGLRTSTAKNKDLLMMPARVALALQADGWWLRSAIVWSKPNPMPESVTDRPTSSYEMVYLLAKQPRYFYDADAVREEACEASLARIAQPNFAEQTGGPKDYGATGVNPSRSMRQTLENFAANPGRNCRNVWTIATAPFSEAHFATFPPELAERCIRAGTSERGCCSACGKPWVRLTQATGGILGQSWSNHADDLTQGNATRGLAINRRTEERYQRTTTGWAAGCACDAPTRPCTVLDPFSGAGTTLLVADRLQRHAVGIELNPEYAAMGTDRVRRDAPLLAEVV